MTPETQTAPAAAAPAAPPAATPPAGVPPTQGDARVHIYDAASTQRERVMKGFDTQREALMKAVADQREAALAPIRAVQARQAAVSGVDGRVLGPRGNTPAAQAATDRSQLITEIATVIRAIVADEVSAQIATLLRTADAQMRATEPPPPAGDKQ